MYLFFEFAYIYKTLCIISITSHTHDTLEDVLSSLLLTPNPSSFSLERFAIWRCVIAFLTRCTRQVENTLVFISEVSLSPTFRRGDGTNHVTHIPEIKLVASEKSQKCVVWGRSVLAVFFAFVLFLVRQSWERRHVALYSTDWNCVGEGEQIRSYANRK